MVARRYKKNPVRWLTRGIILWILPLPLIPAFLISLLQGNLSKALGALLALSLIWIGALWIRKGLKQEIEYGKRRMTKAPRLPWKIFGTAAVTLGTLICAWFAIGHSLLFALFTAALAFIGCYLSYGFDPRRDKVGNIADGFGYTSEEILEAIDSAEKKIAGIEESTRHFTNHELISRLERITVLARKIVGNLEKDPHDLRKVRKFINVYLDGAEKVTTGYVQTMKKTGSEELGPQFRKLLETIENVFEQQHKKLLANDILDLDIKMEVLMKQLHHEGIL